MKKKVNSVFIIFLLGGILLFSGCYRNITATKQYYYDCPIHQDYIAYFPGECPKCGMKLQQWEMDKSQKKKNSNSHSDHNSNSGQSGSCH